MSQVRITHSDNAVSVLNAPPDGLRIDVRSDDRVEIKEATVVSARIVGYNCVVTIDLSRLLALGAAEMPVEATPAAEAGAAEFIEKPTSADRLLASGDRALERSPDAAKQSAWREQVASRFARLTPREREIMDLVLAGHPSKNIAMDLGISQRTVENHRAALMKKTGAKSLPALVRLALATNILEAE